MPTVVSKAIRSDAAWLADQTAMEALYGVGGYYTTISAALAAEVRNLVSADEVAEFVCYDDWPSGLTDNFTVSTAWTVDSTRFVRITVAPGHRHDGTPGTGFWITSSGGAVVINGLAWTEFEWLDLVNTSGSGHAYQSGTTSNTTPPKLRNVIAKGGASGNAFQTLRGDILENCWARDSLEGFNCANFRPADLRNCKATNNGTYGFRYASGSTATLRNCAAYNNGTNYSGTYSGSSSNNATSTGSDDAPGGSSVTNVDSADFVNAAGNDFHLASGSALIGTGIDLSSLFSGDIDGDTRPTGSAWDIGFDHYVSAGGPTTVTATTSLALAVQQARAIAAGMQVAVQTSGQSTTSASVAVQAARTAQAGLTAAVQQAHSAVASLAAAVQAPGVQSTALAAAVQLAGSAVTSLGLAVQAQGSATTGVSLQVQAQGSATTGVSLQVQAGSSVSVAASLAVLRQALATVGLSMAVVAPGSASTGLSVALRAAQSATSALALAVQAARSVSASVSLQVQDGLSIAAALNVAVQRAASATTAVQLAIAQATTANASLAAAVMVRRSVAAATSAAVRAGRSAGAGVGLFVFDAGPVDPDAAAVWSHVLSNGKTAGQNQVEIHAMLTALIAGAHVLPVDVLKMNSAPVIGDGTVGNDWRGVGVQPQ